MQVGSKQKVSLQQLEEERLKAGNVPSRTQYQEKARRYAAPTLKKIQSGVAWHKVCTSADVHGNLYISVSAIILPM